MRRLLMVGVAVACLVPAWSAAGAPADAADATSTQYELEVGGQSYALEEGVPQTFAMGPVTSADVDVVSPNAV